MSLQTSLVNTNKTKRFFFSASLMVFLSLFSAMLFPTKSFALQAPPVFKLQWGSAGTGNGQFGDNIAGLAVDNNGFVYVADRNNNLIQKFTSSGTFVTQWSVASPQDVKVNTNGNIWVVSNPDGGPKTVQIFTSSGTFLSTFLTLNDARQLAFDPAGNVYVDNHFFGEVNKYDPNGTPLTAWGTGAFPVGIAVDGNANVYVSLNRGGGPVNKYDAVGNLLATFSFSPFNMAVDSHNNIFGADPQNHQVVEFAPDGTLITQWGTQGTGNGQFESPQAVAVDSGGNVYVGDALNHNIQVFTSIAQVGVSLDAQKINPKSNRELSVSVLSSSTFDATTINPTTVHFGASGTEATTTNFSTGDVNGDGLVDMTFVYHVQGTGITCSTTSVTITGQTTAGQSFSGTTPITIVGCH